MKLSLGDHSKCYYVVGIFSQAGMAMNTYLDCTVYYLTGGTSNHDLNFEKHVNACPVGSHLINLETAVQREYVLS